MNTYEKKGYLHQKFRLFHLKDRDMKEYAFHYHDFHKIILFLDGEGQYIVEGKTYPLKPRDVLFVSAGEIHRPVTFLDTLYERIVLYIMPEFLREHSQDNQDLAQCFKLAQSTTSVMHLPSGRKHDLMFHVKKLEEVINEEGFAHDLYAEIMFLELLILLNRSLMDKEIKHQRADYNPRIQEVIEYINTHLDESISIQSLADITYLSRFHLMRQFKADTGYSIHQYISSKRLLMARELLTSTRDPITSICYSCGFRDYSAFSREFKRQFGTTPRALRKEQ